MIKINILPDHLRKEKGGLFDEGLGQFPREVIVGIFVAVLGALLCLHILLLVFTFTRMAQIKVLGGKWEAMAADKKVVDEVLGQIKEIQSRATALKPIVLDKNILWSEFVRDISSSLPKGVSLLSITLDKQALEISGTAVSRKKKEMLIAGDFVAALKKKPVFVQHFTDIQAEYFLQRQDSAKTPTAGFTIKAKLK